MKYIISYDISSSRIRKEFSDFLLSENFIRIQKSVFIGNTQGEKKERTPPKKVDKYIILSSNFLILHNLRLRKSK